MFDIRALICACSDCGGARVYTKHMSMANVAAFIPQQMKFTDAMRSKARLSITGSTSENGRVPVAYLRPGLSMSLSMTDLS